MPRRGSREPPSALVCRPLGFLLPFPMVATFNLYQNDSTGGVAPTRGKSASRGVALPCSHLRTDWPNTPRSAPSASTDRPRRARCAASVDPLNVSRWALEATRRSGASFLAPCPIGQPSSQASLGAASNPQCRSEVARPLFSAAGSQSETLARESRHLAFQCCRYIHGNPKRAVMAGNGFSTPF